MPVYSDREGVLTADRSTVDAEVLIASSPNDGTTRSCIATTVAGEAEDKYQSTDPFARSILNSLPQHIAVVDAEGVILAVNDSWRGFAAENGGSVVAINPEGSSYRAACALPNGGQHQRDASLAWQGIESVLSGRQRQFVLEYSCDSATTCRWFRMEVFPMHAPSTGAIVVHNDVTEATLERQARDNEQAQLRTLLKTIPDLVWMKDLTGRYLVCNPAFEAYFGASEAEIVGRADRDFVDPELAEFFRAKDQAALAAGTSQINEEWITFRSDGRHVLLETTKTPVRDAQGRVQGVLGIGHDITDRYRMVQRIQDLALHDALTGLANRRLLEERLKLQMASSRRSGQYLALLLVDLDNFKPLNDQHGHHAGDQLLVEAAKRLLACVRDSDTVARFGGDEFVVQLGNLPHDIKAARIDAINVAEKIRQKLADPYWVSAGHPGQKIREVEHRCTASIGIALALGSTDGDAQEALIRRADVAMYRAKERGRNQIYFDADVT